MRNNTIIIALFLISVLPWINAYANNLEQTSNSNPQSDSQVDTPNPGDIHCIIDIEYDPEACLPSGISNIRLVLNNSYAVIRTKTINNEWTKIKLNKWTYSLFRVFLIDLYSNHNSAIADKYISERRIKCPLSAKCNINLTLNGKKTTENINIYDYLISFDEPFNIQFDRIRQLIYAITNKIERDCLQFENAKPEAAEWITKILHDNFFEPQEEVITESNDVISNSN